MFKDLLLHLEEENYALRAALKMMSPSTWQQEIASAALDPESDWRKRMAQEFRDQHKKLPPCG